MNGRKKSRLLSFFVFLLLIVNMFSNFTGVERVSAAPAQSNAGKKRAIGIVFDDSGSMYKDLKGNNPDAAKAWCRATYAMEAFATMMNENDVMYIHPMNSISVGQENYNRNKPLEITQATANKIRSIISKPGDTHIEAITAACSNLEKVKADEKWLIVLTDGDEFYRNGAGFNALGLNTAAELEKELTNCVQKVNVMYLGIGSQAAMPKENNVKGPYQYISKATANSTEVLDTLSSMCNTIFGRDALPNAGKTLSFDVSLSKLIVFVQGSGINNVKLDGKNPVSTHEMKYASKGTDDSWYASHQADTSLQGKMLIYENLTAGEYALSYEGTASNISCYYELDADLVFVFTDADGNDVDPQALYEGDYKMSFGMKDAKTGKIITSELLGNPHYEGDYTINGKSVHFTHDGYQGEESISLKMNDTFYAELTVTYLSDFTITKDSSSFGWPEGGIRVAARPAGDLKMEISGGEKRYYLQTLQSGTPFTVKIFYQGTQLTGDVLKSVVLKWDETASTAKLEPEFAEDHYKLKLNYKDPKAPQETLCGPCTVKLKAFYTAQGSSEAQVQSDLKYYIDEDAAKVKVDLNAPEDYIVIKDLADSKAIVAKLTINGRALTPEEFKRVEFKVDCGGIAHTVIPNPEESTYFIQLQETAGIEEDDYTIKASAVYTDALNRTTQAGDDVVVTLSNMPLWLKWLIGLLILFLLIFLIWRIAHIRVLPSLVRHKKDECYMSVTGRNITEGTDFNAKRSGKQLSVRTQYNGNTSGISISNIKPGKESFLYKAQQKRNMTVCPENVKMIGEITYADINGVGFIYDKTQGKLVPEDPDQRPFTISNNANISFDAKIEDNGRTKKSHAEIPLTFKKR